MVQNDDEAWRAIVDNYGDRPDLDGPVASDSEDEPDGPESAEGAAGRDAAGAPSDGLVDARPDELIGPARHPLREPGWDELSPAAWEEERFVPPPAPPVPSTSTDRLVAWLGIFGSPVILLVTLILGIRLPELISYLLVIAFVGGFVYLVVNMSREPRDPDDNGAVL